VPNSGVITSTNPWANFGETSSVNTGDAALIERKDREAAATRAERTPSPAPGDPRTLRTTSGGHEPR
jgi:hypothetical protein